MNAFKKTIVAASIAAVSMFGATASAATFNDFEVNPTGSFKNFTADKITGNYNEVATFNPNGTFNVSLYWQAGQFVANDGANPLRNNVTGLDNAYSLYAVYQASGVVSSQGTKTVFTFLPGSGSLSMYLDQNADTVVGAAPTTGSGAFTFNDSGDDRLIAFGDPLSGQGDLDSAIPTCGAAGGINCGSFGSKTSIQLTDLGKTFFVAPNPFYTVSFQSGQLNSFDFVGTQEINGSLDVVFDRAPAEVPEPASVGLLGLGMLGLYAARRRNKKAA